MAFCSTCGTPLPERVAFCPSCGQPVAGRGPATPGAPYPSFARYAGGVALSSPSGGGEPSPASRPTDLEALHRALLAAVVGLVAGALGIAILVLNNLGPLVTAGGGSTGGSLTVRLPPVWIAVLTLGIALGVTELVLWRGAFRTLRATDVRFTTPASLALVAVVGVVLATVGVTLFLIALERLIRCAGPGNAIPSACLQDAPLLATSALILLAGAIVALVGYVGVLVGIWRLGSRFSEPPFKVGAVLLLIPYLSLVGSILLLLAARSASRRLERPPTAPSASFPGPT